MAWILSLTLFSLLFHRTRACNINVGTDPLTNLDVRTSQEPTGDSGVLVDTHYEVPNTCACGILTEWSFYVMGSGTIQLFVSRDTGGSRTIIGSASFYVPPLSASGTTADNYFQVSLSSEMWISVQSGDRIGFFNEGSPPMVTYEDAASTATRYTGFPSIPSSFSSGTDGGTDVTRKYAVMVKIEDAKPPFFLNLPYTTTLYTHQTGTVITTYSVTDLDPQDVDGLNVSDSGVAGFTHDPAAQTITYSSKVALSNSPVTITMTVTDPSCGNTDVQTITVYLLDEPFYFNNLPAGSGATIDAFSGAITGLPFTIDTTDPSGDPVTCSIDDIQPIDPGGFTIDAATKNLSYSHTSGSFTYDSAKYIDILISCQDDNNVVKSNFVVDIVKNLNQPPSITNLPDTVSSVDTNAIPTPIKTITATDPEGDAITFDLSCTSSSGAACNISVDQTTGEVTAASLPDAGYDITVTISDGNGNTAEGKLTVTVTGFKSAPVFTNLPATRNIVEGTPAGSYLYKVNYKDENIFNTFTLSKTGVSDPILDTYIDFNVTTGVVSVKAEFDYEALANTSGLTMDLMVTDSTGETANGTMTFNFENKNERPTITIGNPSISADEGPKGTVFNDTAISASDPDTGDTALLTYSMNCGTLYNKYFYLNDADMKIYFSREYDLDAAGLADTVNCNVTVSDRKQETDTGSITLTINDINDCDPRFPKRYYTYFLTPDDISMTLIDNIEAYDNDLPNDVLTYTLGNPKSGSAGDYFIMDAGNLSVKDVSTFSLGTTYYFDVIVTDATPLVRSGTAQVFIIFSDVSQVHSEITAQEVHSEITAQKGTAPDATTTTERTYTFTEDGANYAWITVVGIIVLALLIVIVFIIYLDPPVRKAIARRVLRMQELFKEKPKEPKRIPVGKLKVAMGHKVLESDPDSKLPWELLASDSKSEGANTASKTKRGSLKPVEELKIISGVPKLTSVEAEVHSSSSGDKEEASNNEESSEDEDDDELEGGEDQWGDLGTTSDKLPNKTSAAALIKETENL